MTRVGALLLAAGLLLALVVVLRRRSETVAMPQAPRDGASGDEDIDWDELERAEREVRDLDDDGSGGPPEDAKGDDWGPGIPKPPPAV